MLGLQRNEDKPRAQLSHAELAGVQQLPFDDITELLEGVDNPTAIRSKLRGG